MAGKWRKTTGQGGFVAGFFYNALIALIRIPFTHCIVPFNL
jgi:hypothetical protein